MVIVSEFVEPALFETAAPDEEALGRLGSAVAPVCYKQTTERPRQRRRKYSIS